MNSETKTVMSFIRLFPWIFSVFTMILGTSVVSGQDFPAKTVRIVTGGAGGSIDFMARVIGQGISGALGQPVVVDNRASVVVAAEFVAKAPPDGHTLLAYGNPFWISPLLHKSSYDPVRDFSPITWVGTTPNIIVTHPSLPVRTIKELIVLAKAKPNKLNYAASGIGGAGHLGAELFKHMAGVRIVHINYKSSADAINNVMGGYVPVMFATGAAVAPHLRSGRLRSLAVTTAQPSPLFPGMPTVAAELPGYEAALIIGIFTAAKTPAGVVTRLNQEIVRLLRTADTKEKFFNSGSEAVGSTPEQLATTVISEIDRLGKVIRDAGIRGE